MAFFEMFWATYAPLVILILYLGGRSAWCALQSMWDRRQYSLGGSRYARPHAGSAH
jgi:hypothetical protein